MGTTPSTSESSGLQDPLEHPGRAEAIRRALSADGRFDVVEPAPCGTDAIGAVHEDGLVRFLESAWSEYQREVGPCHDVVPDVFAVGGLRAGMGAGAEPKRVAARLGWWCFETTTPLTEGTYDAARSAVDAALGAADAVLDGQRLAYALCRPPGHHATRSLYGGYCFFNSAPTSTCRSRPASTTTGTSKRSPGAAKRSPRSIRPSSWCRWAPTRSSTIRCATSP